MSFEDTRFCVYLHRRKDNQEVFYIGKGTLSRTKDKTNRSKRWKQIVEESSGFQIEIYKDNLTEDEALTIETELIKQYGNLLINEIAVFVPHVLDKETLTSVYAYDENSPSKLKRISKVRGQGTIGSVGYIHKGTTGKQYWYLRYQGISTPVHRIIWTLLNGDIPSHYVIDHIDGNGLNNDLQNLRCVSKLTNSHNKGLKRDKEEPVGVHYYQTTNSYVAMLTRSGIIYKKSFSGNKYGREKAFALAVQWRQEKIKELNEQGAGYTDRHGT